MKRFLLLSAVAALLPLMASAALAQCVTKSGQGTGSNEDNAVFQAWEAVLQATDWGSWANWMATSQKPGTAPGFTVSGFQQKCGPGGALGIECVTQATLCKKD